MRAVYAGFVFTGLDVCIDLTAHWVTMRYWPRTVWSDIILASIFSSLPLFCLFVFLVHGLLEKQAIVDTLVTGAPRDDSGN